MIKINIKGPIIPNSYKWYYDFFGEDSTCPADVLKALEQAAGAEVQVYINSPGGIVDAGSEIYTAIRNYTGEKKIYIVGEACSAASVIAMAAYCEMSPTAVMMVHCASGGMRGNHNDMEHIAEVLRTIDDALANAYCDKTGMSKDEAIRMMEKETWLNAEQAKERGLIDAIMFRENISDPVAASNFVLPSEEQMNKVKSVIKGQNQLDSVFLIEKTKSKLNLLKLKGEIYEF